MTEVLSYLIWNARVRFGTLTNWADVSPWWRSSACYYTLIILAVMALYWPAQARPFMRKVLPVAVLTWIAGDILSAAGFTGVLPVPAGVCHTLSSLALYAMLVSLGILLAIPVAYIVFLWRSSHAAKEN